MKRASSILLPRSILASILGPTVFFLLYSNLSALDPGRRITQYDIRLYQAKDGLPLNSVKRLFQDSKGFIWIATQEGFVRFDGMSFRIYNKKNVPGLSSNFIWDIAEEQDGNLWLATDGGRVSCFDGQTCTTFDTSDGLSDMFVYDILVGLDGTLWVGTQHGVSFYRDGKFGSFPELSSYIIHALHQNKDGDIYVGSHKRGIVVIRNDEIYTTPLPFKFLSFCDFEPDLILAGNTGGEIYHEDKLWLNPFPDSSDSQAYRFGIRAMHKDKDGNLWLATEGYGIARITNGRVEKLSHPDDIPTADPYFYTVLEDTEGSIWFGGDNGVLKLTDNKFVNFGKPEGAHSNFAQSVCEDDRGRLLATFRDKGLSIFEPNGTLNIGVDQGLVSPDVGPILVRSNGEIWVSSLGRGLNVYRNGEFTLYDPDEYPCYRFVWSLYEDGPDLWIGSNGCLTRFNGVEHEHHSIDFSDEPSGVRAIIRASDSTVWFGTWGRGLYRLREDGPARVLKRVSKPPAFWPSMKIRRVICGLVRIPMDCTDTKTVIFLTTPQKMACSAIAFMQFSKTIDPIYGSAAIRVYSELRSTSFWSSPPEIR